MVIEANGAPDMVTRAKMVRDIEDLAEAQTEDPTMAILGKVLGTDILAEDLVEDLRQRDLDMMALGVVQEESLDMAVRAMAAALVMGAVQEVALDVVVVILATAMALVVAVLVLVVVVVEDILAAVAAEGTPEEVEEALLGEEVAGPAAKVLAAAEEAVLEVVVVGDTPEEVEEAALAEEVALDVDANLEMVVEEAMVTGLDMAVALTMAAILAVVDIGAGHMMVDAVAVMAKAEHHSKIATSSMFHRGSAQRTTRSGN